MSATHSPPVIPSEARNLGDGVAQSMLPPQAKILRYAQDDSPSVIPSKARNLGGGLAQSALLLGRLIAFSAVLASAARPADDLPILVYVCPKTETPPTIDGQLDDACWKPAPVASGFTYFGNANPAPVQTFFRVVYDDTALYFGIICDEPTPQEVALNRMARDSHEIFSQEAVEIFLDPNDTQAQFYQLGINAGASLCDMAPGGRLSWNGDITAATAMGENAWYVETRVAWSTIGVSPELGQLHGFNVCRDRYLGPDRQWTNWSRTIATFHDPVRFAHLVLSPTVEQLSALAPEFRKGDRGGPLLLFTSEGVGDQTYRQLLMATLREFEAGIGEIRDIAERECGEAERSQIEARLKGFEAEGEAASKSLSAEPLDAETLIRLETRLSQLRRKLNEAMWEARLTALLAGI